MLLLIWSLLSLCPSLSPAPGGTPSAPTRTASLQARLGNPGLHPHNHPSLVPASTRPILDARPEVHKSGCMVPSAQVLGEVEPLQRERAAVLQKLPQLLLGRPPPCMAPSPTSTLLSPTPCPCSCSTTDAIMIQGNCQWWQKAEIVLATSQNMQQYAAVRLYKR